ncbi:metal ABC transporter ATP-binding protein [Bengtsoniella intestinalis]|uniref:metal ABC transporter ATP-binding protein n=1 Tax=Bengtsoniella intestinalis TaxID=3073143 RepID=UPI00391EE8B0
MAQISCNGLSLGYEGTLVIEGLDLQISQGDYLCILGENGAGKSTLMKAMLGLHPRTSGTVTLGDGVRAKDIGYLTQQSDIQRDFPASVAEIVRSGCQSRLGWRPFYNRQELAQVATAMERMGIAHLAKRCYRQLSGGQQQRVLLARALCATQKVLFLDEPVTGLDPEVSREFYQLLSTLHRQEGVTIVMISHDVEGALNGATHVLSIGQPSFYGTKADYLKTLAADKGGETDG